MLKFAPVQSILRMLFCLGLGLFCANWSSVGQSSLFWVFNFAPVWRCFVLKFAPVQSIFKTKFCPGLGLFLISLREKNTPYSSGPAPVLGSFVLKFAPVQSNFRTKFCSGLGLFFIFLRGEKCPVQPCSAPVQDRGIVTLLAFLALKVLSWC